MAKNSVNFTKEALEKLPLPPEGTRATYHDAKVLGLQLRVTSNGIKTFCAYRWVSAEGKPERITLGRYPELSIERARKKTATINAAIANDENPGNALRADKAELTFAELFKLYLDRWAKPHKKSWQQDENNFRRYIQHYSRIGNRKLSRITRGDIAALHVELGKERPITANRVLALISSVFGRARELGLWDKPNPAQGIRKIPERGRERFIQSEELPVFFEALTHESSEIMQDYFLLLLLTGVRRSNLMAMRWDEISFERKEWRISETKNGTSQIVSLDDGHGTIMRILETRKAKAEEKRKTEAKSKNDQSVKIDPWVFPSPSKTGHLVEPHRGWERLLMRARVFQLIELVAIHKKWKSEIIQQAKREANARLEPSLTEYRNTAEALGLDTSGLGFDDLRIHDLRRTLGSWMAGTGATTVLIGKQLNQKSEAATRIYSRLQLDPVREARNKAISAMFGTAGIIPAAQITPITIRNKN